MPIFTRGERYERVWTTPVRTLAEELGISDVGLKKACKKADIPVPERGYWARHAAGKGETPTPRAWSTRSCGGGTRA